MYTQLFGNDVPSDSHPEGMIFQLLQQLTSEVTDMKQCWLVCDGPLELNKMEVLQELLCGDGSLSLNTGHKLTPSGTMISSCLCSISFVVVCRFMPTVIGD